MSSFKSFVRDKLIKLYYSRLGRYVWEKSIPVFRYNLVRKATLKALADSGYQIIGNENSKLMEVPFQSCSQHALVIFPYFVENAASAYIRSFALALKELGYVVHAFQYNENPIFINDKCFDVIHSLKAPAQFRQWDIHRSNPIFENNELDDWVDRNLLRKISALNKIYNYRICVCNYVFLSAAFNALSSDTLKILCTHDVFFRRNKKLSDSGVESCFFDFSCSQADEVKGLKRADYVIAIQDQEASYFAQQLGQSDKVITVPFVCEARFLNKKIIDSKKIVVGYLASAHRPNIVAIKQLLKKEFPENILFKVGGSICSALSKNDFPKNVELVGRVDSLDDFYSSCDIFVNPDMLESGLKIKCVEALSFGLPLVCTRASSQGLNTDCVYHLCQSIEECAEKIIELSLDSEKLFELANESKRLFSLFTQKSSPYACLRKIICETKRSSFVAPQLNLLASSAEPKVSIILPTYKVERYFEQALLSVQEQTLKNIEIIPVDDGSPDNCAEIMDSYARDDKRIHPIHQANGGYGKAINAGLQMAKGEFIAILEPDDWIEPTMYEDLYNAATIGDDVIKAGFYKHIANSDLLSVYSVENRGLEDSFYVPSMSPSLVLAESSIWSAIYRREFLLKNGLTMLETKGASYQDVVWKFLVYASTTRVKILDKALYHYRYLTQNSSSKSSRNPEAVFTNYTYIKSFLDSKNSFQKWKKLYYQHFYLDMVFHYNRLSDDALVLFREQLKVFIAQAEKIGCGIEEVGYPERMLPYVIQKVYPIYSWAKRNSTL